MALHKATSWGAKGTQNAEHIRVDGFPGPCLTLSTVIIKTDDYLGSVWIEASFSSDDSVDDWVVVDELNFEEKTSAQSRNVIGKFVWLRFRFDETTGGDLAWIRVT